MKNIIIGVVVVAAVLGALAFFGLTPFGKEAVTEISGSPAGSTFNTAKVAAINFTPATPAASSTSLLNTDSSARYIQSGFASCSGVTGQGGTFTAATTTIPNLGVQGNTNSAETIIATTTAGAQFMYSASSTEGVISQTSRVWPSGTYLTFVDSNTNTGICTVGVDYLGS